MSASDVIELIANGWNVQPTGMASGMRRPGMSAALWSFPGERVHDLAGEAFPNDHLISLPVSGVHRSTYWGDGHCRYARSIVPWHLNIVPAGEAPRAVLEASEQIQYLHIYLPTALVDAYAAFLPDRGSFASELIDPCSAFVDIEIAAIGRTILSEMTEPRDLARLRLDALGDELTVQLLRRHSSLSGALAKGQRVQGGLAPWQERRCTEYLRDNMAEDVDLATLAGVANLSPFHFARMFKKTTGVPPHRYQLLLRLERAKALLVETEMSVLEVALSVGYDSPQTLARLFQRELGVTPSAYRRERKL